MTAQLKIKENEATLLRTYYEEVARNTLGVLWHQKLLIGGIVFAALLFASIFLVLIGPRYTSEPRSISISPVKSRPPERKSSRSPRSTLLRSWMVQYASFARVQRPAP